MRKGVKRPEPVREAVKRALRSALDCAKRDEWAALDWEKQKDLGLGSGW